jgi:ligand-binding sensor domain-containing protein/two-component sensor histidine kinase
MKWLTIFLLVTQNAWAQQLRFDRYDATTGLVSNEISRMVQGPDGVMYFGTPNGLSCYDGGGFFNYNGGNGFTEGFINHIQVAGKDSILIFPSSACYYILKGHQLTKRSLPVSSYIRSLCPNGEQGYYAATREGLFTFSNGQMQRLPVYKDDPQPGVMKVIPWRDSLIVIGRAGKSLDVFNRCNWKKIASYPKLYVRDLCADGKGNVWIASIGEGVQCLSPASVQGDNIVFASLPDVLKPFSGQEFRSIVTDRQGNLWMSTISSGILCYNPGQNSFRQISTSNGLTGNTVFCLYTDREDNLWIGTNNGLQKLVHKDWLSWSSREGLPADLVLDIHRSGTYTYTTGYYGLGIAKTNTPMRSWNPLTGGDYFSQFLQQGNTTWLFAEEKLWQINTGDGSLNPIKKYDLRKTYTFALVQDDKNIFLAGDSGIALFGEDGSEAVLTKEPAHVIATKGNQLYAAGPDNMYRIYDLQGTGTATVLTRTKEIQLGEIGKVDELFTLVPVPGGSMACGSAQQGIFIISGDGKVRNITMKDGLGSNSVRAILWLNDTVLLAGTGAGIDRIIFGRNGKLVVKNSSAYYGFSSGVYCLRKDETGGLLAGTESGLISISKADLVYEVKPYAPVIISSFSLLNGGTSLVGVPAVIDLDHNQNGFEVRFASPSFINERATRYSYWLKGSGQKDWSRPSADHVLTFSGLAPGRYTLMVKVADDAEGKITSLDIRIRPPFWQRWWFYGLAVLIVLALGYALYRYRVKQLFRVEKMRQKISSDLHDDIGATLTGVSFLTELARSGTITEDTRDQYLAKASEQTRNISERLADIVWSINPGYDKLDILLYKMRRYAGELLESKGINYQVNFPETVDDIKLGMESRQHLYLIFKEALNNIVKYAFATQVSVTVTVERKELVMVIGDNGTGFDEQKTVMGNGIANMKHRAALAGGSCTVVSSPGAGTEVRAAFPVGH